MVRIDEETLALLDFEYCISICPWEFFLSQCSAALDLYKRSGFQGFTPPYDISYRGLKLLGFLQLSGAFTCGAGRICRWWDRL